MTNKLYLNLPDHYSQTVKIFECVECAVRGWIPNYPLRSITQCLKIGSSTQKHHLKGNDKPTTHMTIYMSD